MPIVASIDVGIKNLAMCVMQNNPSDSKNMTQYTIKLWDVFNLLDNDNHLCAGQTKKGLVCGKKCSLTWTEPNSPTKRYSCKTHFPKHITQTTRNKYAPKKVNDDLLQDIALVVIVKMNELFVTHKDIISSLDKVVIELQPKVNNKMKFISHIIYAKFVEFFANTQQKTSVRFVRAAQKLKAYTGPALNCTLKGAYAKRKWLSVQYTTWFLTSKFCSAQKDAWLQFLQTHSKADDLCDTFLMTINELHGIVPQAHKAPFKKVVKTRKKKTSK
jgi:hypothetical protein